MSDAAWIPVMERLPEVGKDVLVYDPAYRENPVRLVQRHFYESASWFEDDEFRTCDPTHWMPLPEPLK